MECIFEGLRRAVRPSGPDARFEFRLRSHEEAPRSFIADELLRPAYVTAAWTIVFRLPASVSGLENFPRVVRDSATCRLKRGTFFLPSAKICSLWPQDLGTGRKQGLPEVGDLRYLIP